MDLIEFAKTYYLQLFITSLIPIGIWLYRQYQKQLKKWEIRDEATKTLLSSHIIDAYERSKIRGYFPLYERYNVEAMYKSYKDHGANGSMDDIMAKMKSMPDSPPFVVQQYDEDCDR